MSKKKRIFAIYLPQFHPIPENDLFWGKGFTEWRNVAAGKPLFKGHNQPQLPADLGFYDLRLPAIMEEQSAMANRYGIDGFLFYHYWFNGKPLMNIPLENYRNLKQNKSPYFFCWANENWTRRWDGSETEILLKQQYDQKDTTAHFHYLSDYFRDELYVSIKGCPVVVIYKPFLIPDLKNWVDHFRQLFAANGFKGVYLVYMIHQGTEPDVHVREFGFDAGMTFEPSWKDIDVNAHKVDMLDKAGKLLHLAKIKSTTPLVYRHNRIDYRKYAAIRMAEKKQFSFTHFPSLFPAWDNSCRRKNGGGNIFVHSSPEEFKKWLRHTVETFSPQTDEENLIIINAWNEWAEGNHLEPCLTWGSGYLEAVREVVDETNNL